MEIKTTTEITNTFAFARDDEEILNGMERFGYDFFDSGMDGIFKNKASWTRFGNRVDNGELTKWLQYKTKSQYVKKIDIDTIEFYTKQGIKVATGFILDENGQKQYVYDTYTKLILKIDYDWFWSARTNEEMANSINIYATIEKLEK